MPGAWAGWMKKDCRGTHKVSTFSAAGEFEKDTVDRLVKPSFLLRADRPRKKSRSWGERLAYTVGEVMKGNRHGHLG